VYRTLPFLLILLLAAGLRFHLLGERTRADMPLYADEALFAAFARDAALRGEWLMPGALDKTPFALYMQAGLLMLIVQPQASGIYDLPIDQQVWAVRVVGVFAGVLFVAAAARAAWAVFGSARSAWAAAGLAACSPLAVVFSPAGFTDGPMLVCAALALACAAERRPGWAGGWLLLAFACKQQAVFFAPLVVVLGLGFGWDRRGFARFSAVGAAGLLGLAVWDAARTAAGSPSLFALAAAHNTPGRLTRPDEWDERLRRAWALFNAVFGTPTAITLAAAAAVGWDTARRYPRRRDGWALLILLAFMGAYTLLHLAVAFNLYDRYALLLVVPCALVGGRGLHGLTRLLVGRLPRGEGAFLPLVLALALLGSAWNAVGGRLSYPTGESSFAVRTGIAPVAAWLNALPPGTIVYDRWLGWELDFYLGAWTDKRRVFAPTPHEMAAVASSQPDPGVRVFIAPAGAETARWERAFAAAGFTLIPADAPEPTRFRVWWASR
jgi:4-amino-4-deoxy-L-arabinose transferase-like glycosyltransferase